MGVSTNEAPRTLIRDFQLSLSDECVVAWPKKDAIRQQIIRKSNAESGYGSNAKCLTDLVIPECLQITHKNVKFYYGDSGKDDINRVIFFTTSQNLKLMSTYSDLYCDGTVKKAIEFFRLEQNNMETDLLILFSGETIKQTSKKDLVREQKLKTIGSEYDVLNKDLFLNGIIVLLDDQL